MAVGRPARGRRIERYLVMRGGRRRADTVVDTLLGRGWRAEVVAHPTLMIETSAPARVFEKAWNETK